MKELLKRKNIIFSAKRYGIDALGAMAQGLFASLPKLDDDSKRLKPIKGLPPDPTHLPEGCKFCPRCPHEEECQEGRSKQAPMIEVETGHFVRCHKIGKGGV